MTAADRAVSAYRRRYEADPEVVVRSPGRVNLIGEHTDYNAGLALPMAIDRDTAIAAGPVEGSTVTASSEGFGTASVDRTAPDRIEGAWADYLAGVLWVGGPDRTAWRAEIASDLPVGAAVSSSASLELALLRLEAALADAPWDPLVESRKGARVENEWLGLGSGLLDQVAVSACRRDHALLIDFESLTWDHVPMPDGVAVVLLDTTTRRKLTESRYNDRRADCERAARALGVPTLRHVGIDDTSRLLDEDRPAALRARHIVSENERTLAAADALRSADVATVGDLMTASHVSLRDDFAVSGPELDAIVEAAWDAPGCLGARMTGGGFAGCGVALVEHRSVVDFSTAVAEAYAGRTGLHARLHTCRPAQGTELLVG